MMPTQNKITWGLMTSIPEAKDSGCYSFPCLFWFDVDHQPGWAAPPGATGTLEGVCSWAPPAVVSMSLSPEGNWALVSARAVIGIQWVRSCVPEDPE